MPRKTAHRTDAPKSCQLIDLLKETEGLEKVKVLPTHDRRGIGTDTRSISFVKGDWLIDGLVFHYERVIGRTI
jgi:hypothetical protein